MKYKKVPLTQDEFATLMKQFNLETFTGLRDCTYLMLLRLIISDKLTSSLSVYDILAQEMKLEGSMSHLLIPKDTFNLLKKYLNERSHKNPSIDALFITKSGRILPHIYFRVAFPRYVRRAGIRPGERCSLGFLSYSALLQQSRVYNFLLSIYSNRKN